MSLRERILRYLEAHGDWVHKGVIAKRAEEAGYLAENAGRRLRELAEEGLIYREERKGENGTLCVWYRFRKDNEPRYKLVPEFIEKDGERVARLHRVVVK